MWPQFTSRQAPQTFSLNSATDDTKSWWGAFGIVPQNHPIESSCWLVILALVEPARERGEMYGGDVCGVLQWSRLALLFLSLDTSGFRLQRKAFAIRTASPASVLKAKFLTPVPAKVDTLVQTVVNVIALLVKSGLLTVTIQPTKLWPNVPMWEHVTRHLALVHASLGSTVTLVIKWSVPTTAVATVSVWRGRNLNITTIVLSEHQW